MNLKNIAALSLASLLSFSSLTAKERTIRPNPIIVPPSPPTLPTRPPKLPELSPELWVDDYGKKRAMIIRSVETKVEIQGLLAETEITMVFHNPHARVLHGELKFPLPDGATVSSYGLDIGGKIVDASLVGKHEARIAFEKEVRKRVDPGIAEVVKGNEFRTRVYPIPAKGQRSVRIRYVSTLFRDGESDLYQLPLNFEQSIPHFKMSIHVIGKNIQPKLKSSLSDLSFSQWKEQWVLQKEFKNQKMNEALTIEIPKRPKTLVSIEKTDNGEQYFLIHDSPKPSKALQSQPIQNIGLFWDASKSREKSQIDREITLLKKLFKDWNKLNVDLYVFRDRLEAKQSFTIENGNSEELSKHLQSMAYDGGTNLNAIQFPKASYNFHLLFSDGLGSLGEAPLKNSPVPVYTITSSALHHPALLKGIARHSGGDTIHLGRVSEEVALARIGKPSFSLLQVKVLKGQVEEIYPKGQQSALGRVDVCGKLKSASAEVELIYGIGKTIMHRETVQLNNSQSSQTGLTARFWAQKKVEDLSIFEDKNKEQIIALGRKFSFVTPGTSLIVLENLSQFIEHDIEPPKSRATLHQQWLARRARKTKHDKQQLQNKMNQVVRMWQQRINWWERDYSKRQVYYQKGLKKLENTVADEEAVFGNDININGTARSRSITSDRVNSAPLASGALREASKSESTLSLQSEAPQQVASPVLEAGDDSVDSFHQEKLTKAKQSKSRSASMKIKAWDPKAPYMLILKKAAEKGRAYQTYLDQRAGYDNSPAFYLDCAHFFYQQKQDHLARRILTNLIEMGIDNPAMMRIVAYRLGEAQDLDLQIKILQTVLSLRPEEPHSYRDLALAYIHRGEKKKNLIDVEEGLRLLAQIIKGQWDRFHEIELIALMDLNRSLAKAERVWGDKVLRPNLDARCFKNLELDVRIILSWDVDLTDVDLWIIEPTGEKAYYGHRNTQIGGLVSRDFTQGYGPEEYCLKFQREGTYTIKANYYGSSQQYLTGPATVKATIYTNFGRENEKKREMTLRLKKVKDVFEVGKIELKAHLN